MEYDRVLGLIMIVGVLANAALFLVLVVKARAIAHRLAIAEMELDMIRERQKRHGQWP